MHVRSMTAAAISPHSDSAHSWRSKDVRVYFLRGRSRGSSFPWSTAPSARAGRRRNRRRSATPSDSAVQARRSCSLACEGRWRRERLRPCQS